jgi:hypothetical protein
MATLILVAFIFGILRSGVLLERRTQRVPREADGVVRTGSKLPMTGGVIRPGKRGRFVGGRRFFCEDPPDRPVEMPD